MNKRQMNSTTLEKPLTKAGTLYLVHVLTHATRTQAPFDPVPREDVTGCESMAPHGRSIGSDCVL